MNMMGMGVRQLAERPSVEKPGVEALTLSGVTTDIMRAGGGRPLVFLHSGAGPDWHSWEYLSRLSEHFAVVAPFHPGFGRHERPRHFRSVDDLAYYYLDLLAALKLEDVLLVGAGFGGWIASEMAVRSTARIGRLALASPFGIKVGGREDRDFVDFHMLEPAQRSHAEFVDPRYAALRYDGKSDEELTVLARGAEAEAFYGWAPFMHNPQLIHWLHRIDVPTLVLRGSADKIIVRANHDAYLDRIADSRMQIVEHAGSHPHIDAPAAFAAAIAAFAGVDEPATAAA